MIALGGGVTGDMTGYTAATYLRGIRFIQVPTTLLSMVDSSIGGKTGVDFKGYKNMVGAFYQPSLVYVNLSVLTTLDTRQRASGMGEILKHALPQDFVKFGLIPEFIGRVPITVSLDNLDRDALIRILQEPKNSLVKQYTKLFELDGVGLSFEEDAIGAIADKALERKTGARGLRAIMENVMLDLMYTIPSDDSISNCVITKDVVEDNLKALESNPFKLEDKNTGLAS